MSSGSSKTGFSRNFVANLIRFSTMILISFFLSPYVVRHLGAAGYGVWTLVAGLVGYMGLLDFGVRQAVNKFVAEHSVRSEHSESSSIVATGLKLFLIAGVCAIALSFGIAAMVPIWFNIPPELVADSQIVMILGGFTVAIALLSGVFGGVVSGIQRFDVQCGLDVGVALLRAGGTVAALHYGYGLVGMAVVHLAASVVNLVAYRIASTRLYLELRIVLSTPMRPYAMKMLNFATAFFFVYVCSVIAFHSDNIVIGIALPVESIAYFAIAASLSKQAGGLTETISHLMTPRISALASVGQEVGPDVLRVAKTATLLITPVVLTFLIRGESFIGLWMGEQYASLSGTILQLLAITLFVGATRSVIINSMTGLGQHKLLVPSIAGEAISNVAISVMLVKPLGIVGVALGTVVPNVIVSLYLFPKLLYRAAGVRHTDLILKAVLLPVLVGAPFGLSLWLVETYMPATNLWMFFGQLLLLIPVFPATAWFFISNDERAKLRKLVLRR